MSRATATNRSFGVLSNFDADLRSQLELIHFHGGSFRK
jgi:hypothetical protein